MVIIEYRNLRAFIKPHHIIIFDSGIVTGKSIRVKEFKTDKDGESFTESKVREIIDIMLREEY